MGTTGLETAFISGVAQGDGLAFGTSVAVLTGLRNASPTARNSWSANGGHFRVLDSVGGGIAVDKNEILQRFSWMECSRELFRKHTQIGNSVRVGCSGCV